MHSLYKALLFEHHRFNPVSPASYLVTFEYPQTNQQNTIHEHETVET